MKILWITNIPSPYRVKFFNEVGKKCDLNVIFEKSYSFERDKSWREFDSSYFKYTIIGGINVRTDSAFSFKILKYIKKNKYDKVVVTNYSDPSGLLALMALKIKRIPYIIEGDGAFCGKEKGIKAFIKRNVISKADCCFSTSEQHDNYYLQYGAKRIVRYPFTSICASDIDITKIGEIEKNNLRKKLHIEERIVFLSVGQFIYRKGYDILLKAINNIKDIDIGIYIVGGEPTQEYLSYIKKNNITNVHFIGFINQEMLKNFYHASDVFIHPTREDIWGLVINEAMSYGLPIITTNKCIAGLELVDEKNGRLIPADNVDALTKAINELVDSDLISMGKESIKKIRNYSIERMAEKHIELWMKY